MASLARVRHTPSGALCFTLVLFDRAVIDEIKAQIPPTYRGYDRELREWTVVGGWADRAVRILRRFGEVELVADERADRAPVAIRPRDAEYRELHLLPSAPPALVRVVYLELAKEAHPDRGGDAEAMRRINLAYEAIRAVGAEAAS